MKKKVPKVTKKAEKREFQPFSHVSAIFPEAFELIPETETAVPSKKTGHLQETAEIVEVLYLFLSVTDKLIFSQSCCKTINSAVNRFQW